MSKKPETYTVQEGDTLIAIAARLLGSADHWPDLYRLNRAYIAQEQRKRNARQSGPNWIYPGMVLTLPKQPQREEA